METKTVKNGQGSKAEATQTKDTSKGVAALAVVKAQQEVSPIDQRVNKIAELQRKSVQLHNLREKERELKGYSFQSDKVGDYIRIKDSEGNSFETGNTVIVGEVIKVLLQQFSEKSAQLESEILTAVI